MNYIAIPGLMGKRTLAKVWTAENNEDKADRITQVVIRHFGITKEQIKGKSRERFVTYPRHICIYLIQKYTTMSLKDIALIFGGRDHSTAIHSINTLKDWLETDKKVVDDLENIKAKIKKL